MVTIFYLAPNFVWERGIVLLVWVCDSVCGSVFLFFRDQDNSKSSWPISIKFGRTLGYYEREVKFEFDMNCFGKTRTSSNWTNFFLGLLRTFLQHPNIIKTKYVPSYFFKRFGKKRKHYLCCLYSVFVTKQEHRVLNEFQTNIRDNNSIQTRFKISFVFIWISLRL